jgi:Chaperone of endosialidase
MGRNKIGPAKILGLIILLSGPRRAKAPMNLKSSFRLVLLTAAVSLVLPAQVGRQRDPLPLKHWAAPLYWQSTQIPAQGQAVVATPADATAFSPTAPLVFVAMLPCRVIDTRTGNGFTGAFGPPSLVGGGSRTFPILSSTTCTIPTEAQAYSFDITVVPPGPLTYVTAYPTGQPTPVAAIAVESPQGTLASDTGIIPAGSNGSIDVYASNPTDLVVDINGYYVSFAFAFPNLNAMESNTLGNSDSAIGFNTLLNVSNTACGYLVQRSNTTGVNNTASSGSLNDNEVVRIGTQGTNAINQTSCFTAGIRGVTTGNNDAVPVVIDSNGQLGTVSSSLRFKEDVRDMDTVSSGLMRLRPVTFRYQKPFADGSKPIQYGLIAEEVADVYPDLVAHSADGQIETVKYQALDSMLLNELQKEHKQVQEQAETIRVLEARLAALEKLLSGR